MNVPPTTPVPSLAKPDRWRPLRYVWRVPLLLAHLLISLPLTLLAISPLFAWMRLPGGERFDHRMIRWWSGMLMRIFGFRVVPRGAALREAALLVANHVTWMDIEIIHSQRMACFVAKSEIARWPLVGWLASRGGTIYHRRGSTESLSHVGGVMVERLRAGLAVAVFPEGGTGPGDHVRTFHARIFQAAIDAQVPTQPVALKFSRGGQLVTDVGFRGREGFFGNFLRVLGGPATLAEVMFLEPIAPALGERRRMAEAARARIVAALGVPDRRRPSDSAEPASDDLDPLAGDEAN